MQPPNTGYRLDPHPGILLTGDIATMRELVLHGGVREVNIGGVHHRLGRRMHPQSRAI